MAFRRADVGSRATVLAHDSYAFAMEPLRRCNWQAEIGEGRVHPEIGRWAGATRHLACSDEYAPDLGASTTSRP
jgi:hypothetical protein